MKAFIIHGTGGNPNENWFPWLGAQLEGVGWDVTIPTFPTPEAQSLEAWLEVFEPHLSEIDEQTVLIGHSLGAPFILNVLEREEVTPKACYMVSGFTGSLGLPDFDTLNTTFSERSFAWETINWRCKSFVVFHGDDDPYVPFQKAKNLANNLEAPLLKVEGGGHLNAESGYTEFPVLLERIKQDLSA